MDLFERTSKIGIPTILFGTLTIIFGWLVTETPNSIAQLQLGVIALVFLNLFFYSLSAEKARELEEAMKKLSKETG
ncbi:MAG: hypothetical protein MUC80_00460 [Candidatus Thermoplasmatota archaeon]|jgi:uncharacterized protein YacL|nr:hypothetical protein [Candidatus Thermoplasmatota archaeon]